MSASKPQLSRRPRDLVLVSAGLDLDGGGRALAGRLLARTCLDVAAELGAGCEILALGRSGAPGPALCFGTSQRRLALAAWRRQLTGRPCALVFDLLGPARLQAWLPGPLCAPYLVPLYGIEVWRPLGWQQRRALRRAALCLAISRYTVERARPFCDLSGAHVLPLALEERPPEGAVELDLISQAGTGFLLMVGRMAASERYKGHDEVLEALVRLPGARLVVAGEGDDRFRLQGRAAELGLQKRVLFTGFVSEATLAELYRRSAAFVLPSLGEGFGLVYLEAMRAGKPCIAARGSAAEEVVADGTTGFLVDREAAGALPDALGRLLAHPELARRMGEAGRQRWREQFSFARFQAGLRPLLAELALSAGRTA